MPFSHGLSHITFGKFNVLIDDLTFYDYKNDNKSTIFQISYSKQLTDTHMSKQRRMTNWTIINQEM